MKRTEYLQRPLIEGVVYEITPDMIRVACDHTLFIQVRNCRRETLEEVQRQFQELKQTAAASGKVRLKGVTKFMPAVRKLYPSYCAACDRIEKLYAELTELVRQIRQDGIHRGCNNDELLEAAIQRQNEISRHYWRNSDYSRFLSYYNTILSILRGKLWEQADVVKCTLPIA